MTAFYKPVPHDLLYVKAGGPPDDWASIEVYVDGVRTHEAIEVNVLQGWVEEYVLGERGYPVIRDGQFATQRRRGVVVCRRVDISKN